MKKDLKQTQGDANGQQSSLVLNKGFFNPNLTGGGRIVRLLLGLALVGVGVAGGHVLICIPFVLAGGFVLFEAARGWCVFRACGIKTKI